MNFSTIVLQIFDQYNGERGPNAPFYMLQGKRSGQTIQDVSYYALFSYYHLLPTLQASTYEKIIRQLLDEQLITFIDERVQVTPLGKERLAKIEPLQFDGWTFRGREQIFFERVLLLVQTASYVKANTSRFEPIVRDIIIQQEVRQIYRRYPMNEQKFRHQLRDELFDVLENCSEMYQYLFTYKLTGANRYGWTWTQLSRVLKQPPETLYLFWLSGLHQMLHQLNEDRHKILTALTEGVFQRLSVTDSAAKTYRLYQKGYTKEEIAIMRRLKESTIDDHFVEFAHYVPEFSISPFVQQEHIQEVQEVLKEEKTMRLRVLKERLPHLTYFQIRLILGQRQKEQKEWNVY